MFGKILISSLKPGTTYGKSSISDVWQSFEFVFAALVIFTKVLAACLLNLINIFHTSNNKVLCTVKSHVTLCSTYFLNKENTIRVSRPCVSIDCGGIGIMPRWVGDDVYPTGRAFGEEEWAWNEYKNTFKYQVFVC